jgi:excisionase family DNA binding protein
MGQLLRGQKFLDEDRRSAASSAPSEGDALAMLVDLLVDRVAVAVAAKLGAANERWIDAREAARIAGVSKRFVYEHAHEIPGAVKRGRSLRIPEARFRRWMEGRG